MMDHEKSLEVLEIREMLSLSSEYSRCHGYLIGSYFLRGAHAPVHDPVHDPVHPVHDCIWKLALLLIFQLGGGSSPRSSSSSSSS